jgi:hypothetical protein
LWIALSCAIGAAASALGGTDEPLRLGSTPPSLRMPRGQLDPSRFSAQSKPILRGAPASAGRYRVLSRIRESRVGLDEFVRRCPTAAGGCTPWISVGFRLEREPGRAPACAGRGEPATYMGRVQVVLFGEVVIYDPLQSPGKGWPFRGHDRRVTDPCTARAHEWGYHIEWALDEALRVLEEFVGRSHGSARACEAAFERSMPRAVQRFVETIEESRLRETRLRQVGGYAHRSRFGLDWDRCSPASPWPESGPGPAAGRGERRERR